MSINDFSISAGETKTVNIVLESDVVYAGFQFDLYLPTGIVVNDFTADKNRIPDKTELSMTQQADGSYRFLALAMGLDEIAGTSGDIICITVTAGEDLKSGNLIGYFRNVKLSKKDAKGKKYAEMSFPITIVKNGDSNSDGILNGIDIVDIVNHMMGKPSSTGKFNEMAADTNKDGIVNAADIVAIVNIIMDK